MAEKRLKKPKDRNPPAAPASGNPVSLNVRDWVCSCGKKLKVPRKETGQIYRCESCREPHFILPVNPYSLAAKVKKIRNEGKKTIIPAAISEQAQTVLLQVTQTAGAGWGIFKARIWQFFSQTIPDLVTSVRNWFTPLRIAALFIVLVVAGAGLLGLRQSQQRQAVASLRDSLQQADKALEQKEWGLAHSALANAVEALTRLKRNDSLALEIRQKERELRAATHLSLLSLDEMIREADSAARSETSWQARFDQTLKDHWLVMECVLKKESAPGWNGNDEKENWVLSLSNPIPVRGGQVNLHWPAVLIPDLPQQEGASQRVICAGQILRLERSLSPDKTWILTIAPETAFLWCYPETCEAAGVDLESAWIPGSDLKKIVHQQRESRLGLTQESTP